MLQIGNVIMAKNNGTKGVLACRDAGGRYILIGYDGDVGAYPSEWDWEVIANVDQTLTLHTYESYKNFLKNNRTLWNI